MPSAAAARGGMPQVAGDQSLQSKWKSNEAASFTRESFLGLLEGKLPFIKVPGFVSADTSSQIVQHLLPNFTPYLHATGPSVEKVGLAQFEFQAQSAEDFQNRSGDGKKPATCSSKKLNFCREGQIFHPCKGNEQFAQ